MPTAFIHCSLERVVCWEVFPLLTGLIERPLSYRKNIGCRSALTGKPRGSCYYMSKVLQTVMLERKPHWSLQAEPPDEQSLCGSLWETAHPGWSSMEKVAQQNSKMERNQSDSSVIHNRGRGVVLVIVAEHSHVILPEHQNVTYRVV